MTDKDYGDFTTGLVKLCARFNRRPSSDLEEAYWPSAQRSFSTAESWKFAVQKAIDAAERFPSPDELARLRPQQGDREGHRCAACVESPGWVVSPRKAANVKGGLQQFDEDEAPPEAVVLYRPCPNRSDKRARSFYAASA